MINKYDAANDNFQGITLENVPYSEKEETPFVDVNSGFNEIRDFSKHTTGMIFQTMKIISKSKRNKETVINGAVLYGVTEKDELKYNLYNNLISKSTEMLKQLKETVYLMTACSNFLLAFPAKTVLDNIFVLIDKRDNEFENNFHESKDVLNKLDTVYNIN